MLLDVNKIYEEKKDEIIATIKEFVAVPSFYDEKSVSEKVPFGANIENMFSLIKNKCDKDGITWRDIDGYALEITLGEKTAEDFGILTHIDTVPVQENWSTDPFSLTKVDNWYYALGASDDKGPAAVLYVLLKYLNDLNLKYRRQVRVVLGGDEERGFGCLIHYFGLNEQMTFGVSPDADFPVINFEKSIYDFELAKQFDNTTLSDVNIISVHAGSATNVVPQYTKVLCDVDTNIVEDFVTKLESENVKYVQNGTNFNVTFEGAPAHGSEPQLGVNSIFKFFNFVKDFNLDSNFASILSDMQRTVLDDLVCEKLGLNKSNEFGGTTNNFGVFNYENDKVEFIANIRFTNVFEIDEVSSKVISAFKTYEVKFDGMNYHYIEESSYLYKKLKQSYESATGLTFESKATGGGTYARMLKNGLAFGPSIDTDTRLHQKDERISEKNIEMMFKSYLAVIENICIEK